MLDLFLLCALIYMLIFTPVSVAVLFLMVRHAARGYKRSEMLFPDNLNGYED